LVHFQIFSGDFKFKFEFRPNQPNYGPIPLSTLFFFSKPTKRRKKACWRFSFGAQGFANPFLLSSTVWTRGRRGARGWQRQNFSLSLRSSTRQRPRPPVAARRARTCPTLQRPQASTPHHPWASPLPPKGSMAGQGTTDTTPCCHFAAHLAFTPSSNSTRRPGHRLTVHAALPTPTRPELAARSAQSVRAFRSTRVRTHAAPHPSLHGNVPETRRHRRPAPSSSHSTEPGLNPTVPRLKPHVSRPNLAATDETV
jgi:hypothetical protein